MWMLEGEDRRMQRLTFQRLQCGLSLPMQEMRTGVKAGTIARIAEHRMSDMRHMYANLMRPAGL